MRQFLGVKLLAAAALGMALSAPVSADIMGSLKSQATESLGGGSAGGAAGLGNLGASLGLPSIGAGAASNVAGILEYCLKNKYLKAANADNIKGQLMGKLGMDSPAKQQQDAGYQQGLTGMLSGSDGSSFDISKVKDDIKEKACDYVLDNASSLL
ncbi:DUF2501 domain-containing protein [Paenalcaligenes suwonensis]|uniref:DUF2501 domain-containing protein n=1 Tax=Paenalcaligenes suwonensis TaxID=1202713 RepID=UPI001409B786|nr:DUF2501 domain-containing protein [Paenalcaligenes suwonensis]NHC62987.1 DUF2501 domain-containing protein [Paenalcaligenes suwonensis]